MESIKEENKRKLVIQQLGRSEDAADMELYLRRPVDVIKDKSHSKVAPSKSDHRISTSNNNTQNIYVVTPDSGPHSITSTFRQSSLLPSAHCSRRDKIDIDSDNIETPPVTRKVLGGVGDSKSALLNVLNDSKPSSGQAGDNCEDNLGQFDRFSSARKTRRYKRPATGAASSAAVEEPDSAKVSGSTKVYLDPGAINLSPQSFVTEDKENRLKRWQERLKSLDHDNNVKENEESTANASPKSGETNTTIGPFDGKEAAVHYLQRNNKTNKLINNEDEGFEESQSLVSDTPSQGKDTNSG